MKTDPPETREDVERIAATWIARKGGASWTEADAASFKDWLAESAAHRVAYYRLNGVWSQLGQIAGPGVADRTGLRYGSFALAASVLLLLAGSLVAYREGLLESTSEKSKAPTPLAQVRVEPEKSTSVARQGDTAGNTDPSLPGQAFDRRFRTAVGMSRTLSLPDGSRVILDTDTDIHVVMDDRSRIVEFNRGQGYFNVAHDSLRAFVVNAGLLSVIAVGTEFSVRRERLDSRVLVAEGTVRLQRHTREESSAVTRAGDQLLDAGGIARVEGDAIQIRHVQAAEVERNLSWRAGVLTFRQASLADAAAEFNRYSTRRIVIMDPAIAGLELGGVFRSSDVDAFVRLLQQTFPIDVAVRAGRIEMTARRSP